MTDRDSHDRLFGTAQIGFAAVVLGGALVALIPGARVELESDAADASDTALTYARLSLAERPSDPAARLAYVQRLRRLGRFDDALATLRALELAGAADDVADSASLLGLEIAYEHAIGCTPGTKARTIARAEVARRIRVLGAARLTPEARERIIAVGRSLELGTLVAELLADQGRRARDPDLMRRGADAFLAAGIPERAATLRLEAIGELPDDEAEAVAIAALDELRSTGESVLALESAERLTMRFSAGSRIWDSAIAVALANGDSRRAADLGRARLARVASVDRSNEMLDAQIALELGADRAAGALPFALERAKHSPSEREALETAVRIAAWSGRPDSAYAYQRSLAYDFGVAQHITALEGLASSTGDYESVLSLRLRMGRPRTFQAALELAGIYELVGRPEAAHALLADSEFEGIDLAASLRARAALEIRMRDFSAAALSYEALDAAAGLEEPDLLTYADMLVRLGRADAAIARLSRDDAASTDARLARTRLLAEIAYANDRQETVVTAYRPLFAASALDEVELERLWVSQRVVGDLDGAFETALAAYERTSSPRAFVSAGYLAIEREDGPGLERVLRSVATDATALESLPGYWALRVEVNRQRFVSSLANEDVASARRAIADAGLDLEAASRILGSLESNRTLATAAAGVATWNGDLDRVVAAIEARSHVVHHDETPLERAYSLENDGQGVSALRLSLSALRDESSEANHDDLARQTEWLASQRPRYLEAQAIARTLGDTIEYGGLAGFAYSGEHVTALSSVAVRELQTSYVDPSLAPSLREIDATAEMRVRDAHGRTQITAALVARDAALVPGATASHERRIGNRVELSAMATVNTQTQESPRLRMYGARDAISVRTTTDLPRRFFVGTGVLAERYVDMDRTLVARGLTADAAVGYRILEGARSLNVRALGVAAPRSNEPATSATPIAPTFDLRGAGFVGVATTLAKGDLRFGAPYAASLYYFVELAGGLIVPTNDVGYRAYAGIGVPGLGVGQLRVAADISNVTGAAPGQMRAGLSVSYTYGLWR